MNPNYLNQPNHAPQGGSHKLVLAAGALGLVLFGALIGYLGRSWEVDSLRSQLSAANPTTTAVTNALSGGTTNNAVPARGRDTERQTSINSIATQLEVYFNDTGSYPGFNGQLNNDAWVKAHLKGIDISVTRAPGMNTNSLVNNATPTKDQFGYVPLELDGTTQCIASACPKFQLYWYSEMTNKIQVKDALN